jgi:hypothetical protein
MNSRRRSFIAKVTKEPSKLLSAPVFFQAINGCQRFWYCATTEPTSRWAGVEFNMQDLEIRATKQVMRSLKVITENAGINQQAVEDYENLFQHSLSQSHVEALAALFGWKTPGNLFP